MSLAPSRNTLALDPPRLRRELAASLEALGAGETGLFAFALPAGDPRLALPAIGADGFLWRAGGETWIGAGATQRLRGRGPRRFDELRSAAAEAARALRWYELSTGARALAGGRARWYGGLAFEPGGADAEPWSAFGDAELVLPRWRVGGDAGGNVAVLAISPADRRDGDAPAVERALGELASIVALLRAPARTPAEGALLHSLRSAQPGAERLSPSGDSEGWDERPRLRYRSLVERALAAIAAGEAHKLVPVRRIDLALRNGSSLASRMEALRLSGAPARSALFAFARGESTFVGSTPERLVRVRGRTVETHALAGSERAEAQDGHSSVEAARRLLERPKDRREHEWVVRHLLERLAPLCSNLESDSEPRVLELRHVLHLETEIRGELREHRDVLELVELLHPTPAVAGYPAAEASRWLARHEEWPRGWFSGPVGWLDEEGDGDFRVALRAMVLRPERAYLWAGAGIVAGSDPEAELRETDLKLEPARSALGAGDLEHAHREARVPLSV